MGNVVPRSAGPERIFEDFETARKRGAARPAVASIVAARLDPIASGVATSLADIEGARKKAEDLEVALMACDGASDLEIGAVLDEAWNAMGRVVSSVEYTMVAGSGKSQWTDGDPRKQHISMTILAGRLRQSDAPALQAGKKSWAKRIEAKAAPQEQAAKALEQAEVQLTVVEGMARAVADLAQVSLVRLKRDLKNAGLTEAQIHEIIPDYVPKARAPRTPPVHVAPDTASAEAAAAGGTAAAGPTTNNVKP